MATAAHHPTDRRPIAARSWTPVRRLAAWLARRGVAPNAISLAGMVCGVAAGAAFAFTSYTPVERFAWLAGAALVQLRLLANLLDGMVAIEGGRASPVGELYNEVPDRVSDVATLVGLGYAAGGCVEAGYAAAVAAVFTAYVRAAAKVAGAPQDYRGPMAKPHRMFVVTAVALFLAAAPVGWRPIFDAGAGWGLPAAALGLIVAGCLVTASRRLARAAVHLRSPAP
jgi:phosphatidylglycerophosphate synthase